MSQGVDVAMYFLHDDERSEMVNDILDSKALLVGVPTIFSLAHTRSVGGSFILFRRFKLPTHWYKTVSHDFRF